MPPRCSALPTSAICRTAPASRAAPTPPAARAASMPSSNPASAMAASGVPYQVQYAFKRGIEERTWVEDTGRWFAGPDGKPQRAHGTLRVIDARRAREHVLMQLREVRPAHRRTQPRLAGRCAGIDARRRDSPARLLRLPAGHHRPSRRGSTNPMASTSPRMSSPRSRKRLRARLRGKDFLGRFSGNKFGIVLTSCTPDELVDRRRSPADRRARRADRHRRPAPPPSPSPLAASPRRVTPAPCRKFSAARRMR